MTRAQIQIKRVEKQHTMKTSNASSASSSVRKRRYAPESRSNATLMLSHGMSTSSSVCTGHTTKSRASTTMASTSSSSLKSNSRHQYIEQALNNIAQNDPNTTEVSLKGYSLAREENMIKLVTSLAENTHVKTLCLHGCGIDDLGANILAFALRKNTSIRQLWLNKNNIGDIGAGAIASTLHENQTIEILGLHHNNIGDSGGKAISNAMKNNKVVTEVFLRGNEISEEAASKIYCYCEKNYRENIRKKSVSSNSNGKSSKKSSILYTIQEHVPGTRKTAAKRNSIVAKCA